MRLNQYLSRYGVCSRRAADRLVRSGKVEVNGLPAELGMQVSEADQIRVAGRPVANFLPESWFVLYHKPRGVVCSKAHEVEGNLTQALIDAGLALPSHWLPIGRLDKDSEGLLLLTNQGQFADALLHKRQGKDKIYLVTVDKVVSEAQQRQLADGMLLGEQKTLPCSVSLLAPNILQIVLQQGLHRQIRRMCRQVGLQVLRLQRVEFAGLPLSGLASGQWRHLSEKEIDLLQRNLR
ncbi:pseudouridine synthase [Thiomicrorhabdus xiamenensis]|uniref:Pseudouridine synthase n=1 Tax=Thiomicrorhabdus xiamenensis TaxID=2739063 RepID=A0A7D4TBB6_9GAMM|nr:pseudouridine synthase [Thiomicrorhabdus xiamenensis]QKI89686.1 rRNA pseudouridine synthase [Thiomicrorhabdus xiamenensis]